MLHWNAAAAIVASSGTACKIRHPWATAGHGAASSAASRHHEVCCTICKCRLCSHHEKKTTVETGHVTPRRRRKINYPSPSLRLAGNRADTSGPSSRRSCAFQSDPLNNMNRPATRRGNMRVATAQMP